MSYFMGDYYWDYQVGDLRCHQVTFHATTYSFGNSRLEQKIIKFDVLLGTNEYIWDETEMFLLAGNFDKNEYRFNFGCPNPRRDNKFYPYTYHNVIEHPRTDDPNKFAAHHNLADYLTGVIQPYTWERMIHEINYATQTDIKIANNINKIGFAQ